MTVKQAEILLAAVISARATSFLFSKILLTEMAPFAILGVRFLIAFALMALLFHKHLRKLSRKGLVHGIIVGVLFFATMAFELQALVYTASGTVSLFENLAIVMVPLVVAIMSSKLPSKNVTVALVLAMGGVACFSLGNVSFSSSAGIFGIGEILAFCAALCYTASIVTTAHVSKSDDALGLGIVQIGTMGVLGAVFSFFFESTTPALDVSGIACLAALIIICTGFGFTLQPVAQRYLSAERAGLFCAITPLVASILGIVFLGETVTWASIAGIVLIVSSIFVANLDFDAVSHKHLERPIQTNQSASFFTLHKFPRTRS